MDQHSLQAGEEGERECHLTASLNLVEYKMLSWETDWGTMTWKTSLTNGVHCLCIKVMSKYIINNYGT